ncbi:MFS transporter [Nicoliella spurrieriana]|uniref:MFS transporter n=1 Tax=Nicoliella spurrieriana TaxID=2925830 RepID=UPI00311AABF5
MGLFIGSVLAGHLGDFYGRSKTFQWNLLVFGIATLLAAFAPNVYFLIAMRFIAAVGLGAEAVTGFSMINEFAPVQNRGKWSGTVSVFANLGAPFGFLLSTLLITHAGWRSMFLVLGCLAIVLWFARRHLPESPRWLMIHGKEDEAQTIIEKLEKDGHYDVKNISEDSSSHVSRKRGLLIAITAISATLLCQYMFTSWVPTLLLGKGLNIVHSMWFSTIMMAGAPLGALVGMLLVDKVGRKKTIVPSFVLIAFAGITYAFQNTSTGILVNGFILTALMYVSIASTISVYAPELFSTDFRFRGTGYANGFAKLLITLSPYIVLFTVSSFGQETLFVIIGVIAVLAAIVIAVFGPETKGQRLG